MTSNTDKKIDLFTFTDKIWNHRKTFYWVLPLTFVLSSAYILCIPRTYESSVVVIPETNTNSTGTLGSLASSLGFSLESAKAIDAIHPELYPDILKSGDFLIEICDITVSAPTKEFKGNYYDYLLNHTKYPFWENWFIQIKKGLGLSAKGNPATDVISDRKTFFLTKEQISILKKMQANIFAMVDNQSNLITITVRDQDPWVCAMMADSVQQHIQSFITNYRTQKAQNDIVYYQAMKEDAKHTYDSINKEYAEYIDSHSFTNLQEYKNHANYLQNEAELHHVAYTTFQKQYLAAQAKKQEDTPIFTTISSAQVPHNAKSPRRVLFVLGCCFLVFICLSSYICRKEIYTLLIVFNK